ncbi:hypothetical protein B0H14DRAFT_2578652 [Mycena olivaceomarginata]|nr:hypothetical protein B0H14DRAFT_2578652 [Mycena olivaceomarginata]
MLQCVRLGQLDPDSYLNWRDALVVVAGSSHPVAPVLTGHLAPAVPIGHCAHPRCSSKWSVSWKLNRVGECGTIGPLRCEELDTACGVLEGGMQRAPHIEVIHTKLLSLHRIQATLQSYLVVVRGYCGEMNLALRVVKPGVGQCGKTSKG